MTVRIYSHDLHVNNESGIVFSGEYFCGNPVCALHVRAGDPGVRGSGEWATLGNGITVTRSVCSDGTMICDLCRRVLDDFDFHARLRALELRSIHY